jgi:CubicO group peptidase (beta-lactamase class C family)
MRALGQVSPGFEKLLPVFEEALTASHGAGCALNIRVDGKEVASLWGGEARPGVLWAESTSTILMSCTKALVSLIAAKFVSTGKLDLDLPVAEYWPEFAQAGKSKITVRQAMSHHAGLSALRKPLNRSDVLDWKKMVHALETSEPLFDSNGPHQYHAVTFGWLVGEILCRISGHPLRELIVREISQPLGIEAWIGIPENKLQATALMQESPENPLAPPMGSEHWAGLKKYELEAMTLGNAFPYGPITPTSGFNDSEIRMAEIGGAGGISSAPALAQIWSAAADAESVKLVNQLVIDDMTRVQSAGDPAIHMNPPYPTWGTGFMLSSEARRFLTAKSFGHDGFGGQVTFGDRENKVGFAFITNDMQTVNDNRANSLVDALREIIYN